MTRRLILLLFAVLALAVGVTACGGDDDEASDAPTAEDTTATHDGMEGGTHLTLTVDPAALAFDQTEMTAAAGEITIELVNESGITHNVEVEGNGVEEVSDTISSGTTELTLTLEPGEYTFYCNIPGHREAGMEGTLTVE